MIDVIAVTYHHDESLKCFINSFKAQTSKLWNLTLIHDGEDEFYKKIKKDLLENGYLNDQVKFIATEKRLNDWGHSLRDYGLKNFVNKEYVLITNADNYYVPVFVEEVIKAIDKNENFKPSFIYYNCIHNHNNDWFTPSGSYGMLNSQLCGGWIDMGSAVIKTSLAKKAGFKSREYSADWFYFVDCLLNLTKVIPTVELTEKIHNLFFGGGTYNANKDGEHIFKIDDQTIIDPREIVKINKNLFVHN